MFTSTDPSAWTPDDWAPFDRALDNTKDTSDMVLATLRDVANRVASSGRGAIGPLQELNLATVGLLRAAHTRMKVGEIMVALYHLPSDAMAALDFYHPLLEKDVWTTIDELHGYPRLQPKSHPGHSTNYSPMRRMARLRKMTMICLPGRGDGCGSGDSDDGDGSRKKMRSVQAGDTSDGLDASLPQPVGMPKSPTSPTSRKNDSLTCINCGKHTVGYPSSWAKYDCRLVYVWCQSCYRPRTVSAHHIKTRWNIDEHTLGAFEPISQRKFQNKTAAEYLWAQVQASQSDGVLLAAIRKRKACTEDDGGGGDNGDDDGTSNDCDASADNISDINSSARSAAVPTDASECDAVRPTKLMIGGAKFTLPAATPTHPIVELPVVNAK